MGWERTAARSIGKRASDSIARVAIDIIANPCTMHVMSLYNLAGATQRPVRRLAVQGCTTHA